MLHLARGHNIAPYSGKLGFTSTGCSCQNENDGAASSPACQYVGLLLTDGITATQGDVLVLSRLMNISDCGLRYGHHAAESNYSAPVIPTMIDSLGRVRDLSGVHGKPARPGVGDGSSARVGQRI